jgi:hypothetical protein
MFMPLADKFIEIRSLGRVRLSISDRSPLTMRVLLLVLGCLLLPAFAQAQSGEYEITEIDRAANTITSKLHGQLHTLRVRSDVEVSINGLKARFGELAPGMKVKVTLAEPGVAAKLAATGIRARPPATAAPSAVAPSTPVATDRQPNRQIEATIPANSPDGFPIGDVRKGTRISLQYKSGKWKSWGVIPTENPDKEKINGGDVCRVVIALPSKDGKGGEVLALVPPNTSEHPFFFEAPSDYPALVLRINDADNSFTSNPGSVEYAVKILPPAR